MRPSVLLCSIAAVVVGVQAEHDWSAYPGWSVARGVDGCDAAALSCSEQVHTDSWKCVADFFDAQYKADCKPITTDVSEQWYDSSLRWHVASSQCINRTAGVSTDEPPTYEAIMAVVDEGSDAIAIGEVATESHEGEGPYSAASHQCWQKVVLDEAKCNVQMLEKCAPLAHCVGFGAEPSGDSASRWYGYVRALRAINKMDGVRMHIATRHRCGY